jgi:hypothetical protein
MWQPEVLLIVLICFEATVDSVSTVKAISAGLQLFDCIAVRTNHSRAEAHFYLNAGVRQLA